MADDRLSFSERWKYQPGVLNTLYDFGVNWLMPVIYNPNYNPEAFYKGIRPQEPTIPAIPPIAPIQLGGQQPAAGGGLPAQAPAGGQLPGQLPPPGFGMPPAVFGMMPPMPQALPPAQQAGQQGGGQQPPAVGAQAGAQPAGPQPMMPPVAGFMPMFQTPPILTNPEAKWAEDYYRRLGRRDDFTMGELERANRLREQRFYGVQKDIRDMHNRLLNQFTAPVFYDTGPVQVPFRNRGDRLSRERMRADLYRFMRAGMSPQQAAHALQAAAATGGAGYSPYTDEQFGALTSTNPADFILGRGQQALATAGQFAQASLPYHQLYSEPLLPPDPMAEYGVSKRFTQQVTAGENEGLRQYYAMMGQPQAALWSQYMNLDALFRLQQQRQQQQQQTMDWLRSIANSPQLDKNVRQQALDALMRMATAQQGFGMPLMGAQPGE